MNISMRTLPHLSVTSYHSAKAQPNWVYLSSRRMSSSGCKPIHHITLHCWNAFRILTHGLLHLLSDSLILIRVQLSLQYFLSFNRVFACSYGDVHLCQQPIGTLSNWNCLPSQARFFEASSQTTQLKYAEMLLWKNVAYPSFNQYY